VTDTAAYASLISLVCLLCDPTALSRDCRGEQPSANADCEIGWSAWAGRSLRPRTVNTFTFKCTLQQATCVMHNLNHIRIYKVIK
jgi:hypothetical protein